MNEKLPGVKLEKKLNFTDNISDICKKTVGKLNYFARIVPFIGLYQKRFLMNALFYRANFATSNK